MIDIRMFREYPERVRESEKKRFKDTKNVDLVIRYDREWRRLLKKNDELKHRRNVVTKEIAVLKRSKKPADGKIKEMKKVNEEIQDNDEKIRELLRKRDEARYAVGNILQKDVPSGNDESKNRLIRTWGEARVFRDDLKTFRKESGGKMKYKPIDKRPESHVDVLERLGLGDLEKASRVSGARFYYLKNELVSLNLGLINMAMEFLRKDKFIPVWTPFMLNREAISAAAELADFESQLYKVENEDMFLIATAEQTLATLHMGDVFGESELPKAYAGFSTNFRREAGSHGKDTKGIFRVHQFDKVEQLVFCSPDESARWFERMIGNAEKIVRALGLPYRIMSICSGEMNDNASIKYDLEVWMPAQGRFRELVSCSNCTDYQARKLNVSYMKDGEKFHVHILNSTAVATQRTLVAIMENCQENGAIIVPKALAGYAGVSRIER